MNIIYTYKHVYFLRLMYNLQTIKIVQLKMFLTIRLIL
jgi:hypothetical protein